MVLVPKAVVNEQAMMIKLQDTIVAFVAMTRQFGSEDLACLAVL